MASGIGIRSHPHRHTHKLLKYWQALTQASTHPPIHSPSHQPTHPSHAIAMCIQRYGNTAAVVLCCRSAHVSKQRASTTRGRVFCSWQSAVFKDKRAFEKCRTYQIHTPQAKVAEPLTQMIDELVPGPTRLISQLSQHTHTYAPITLPPTYSPTPSSCI